MLLDFFCCKSTARVKIILEPDCGRTFSQKTASKGFKVDNAFSTADFNQINWHITQVYSICALIDISTAYVQKLDSPFYSLYDPYGQLGSTEESKARQLGTLLSEHKDSRQSLIQDHQIPC